MSVVLNTQLGSLMFTSQVPDIDLTTSDDNEAVVMIVSGGTSIFSATHIPFAKSITVHDIRSVIEQLRHAVVTVLQGGQVPIQSLRDIVDLMRKNETSFPHFRNSNTYKLFEPPVFENKMRANGYWF